jgi:hypothetical protein
VTFGIFLPWNAGEQDAVLDKLVPLSASEGLQIVGAGVLTPVDDGVGAVEGYPPAGMLKPPLVLGYVMSIPGFEIQYHVGGTSYRAVLLQGVWICVPRQEKPRVSRQGTSRTSSRSSARPSAPSSRAPRPGLSPVSGLSG